MLFGWLKNIIPQKNKSTLKGQRLINVKDAYKWTVSKEGSRNVMSKVSFPGLNIHLPNVTSLKEQHPFGCTNSCTYSAVNVKRV